MSSDEPRPFEVYAVKAGGRTLFSRYATRREADDVVAALARFHCDALVVGPDDLPLEQGAA
jgi:hypothetical protein